MIQDRTTAHPGQHITTKTVLIVEDDDSIGKLIAMLLSQEMHCQTLHVTDGFQALKAVDLIKPALLITDYCLPYMSGLELYDMLQEQKVIEKTPVIMMSAQLPEQEVKKRKMVGINKPFELDDLLNTVEKLLA